MSIAFSKIRDAIKGLKSETKSLQRRLEELHQERDLIIAAPLTRADAVTALHAFVDQRAAEHKRILGPQIVALAKSGSLLHMSSYVRLMSSAPPNTAATPITIEAALALAFGDEMKAAAARIIDSLDWPEGAMSSKDKIERLAKIDDEISRVEAERDKLAAEAADAGINI